MAAYSPAPIRRVFDRLKAGPYPAAEFAGILAIKPGYHNSRANNSSGNYSVQRADDLRGDAHAAAALDITLRNPADMARLTGRLIELTKARDPRVMCLREFFGTVNGREVVGLDVRDNRWVTSDDSHLWHVHLSWYRVAATDAAACERLADAIIGGPSSGGGDWFDMATEEQLRAVIRSELNQGQVQGVTVPQGMSGWGATSKWMGQMLRDIVTALGRIEAKIK